MRRQLNEGHMEPGEIIVSDRPRFTHKAAHLAVTITDGTDELNQVIEEGV